MAKRTLIRVSNFDNTLRLCVWRIAWTTFGTSFSTMGFRVGCNELHQKSSDKQSAIIHTTKSGSSIFFPLFFLVPFSSRMSASSVMPRATGVVSKYIRNPCGLDRPSRYKSSRVIISVWVFPPMKPTHFDSPQ